LSMASEADETWSTPPATCEAFFDRRAVGTKKVEARDWTAGALTAGFFGGGGGALAPAGKSLMALSLDGLAAGAALDAAELLEAAGAVRWGFGGGPGTLMPAAVISARKSAWEAAAPVGGRPGGKGG